LHISILYRNDSWSKGKFTCIVGEIDLLAQHETNAEWLIVELKKDKPSDAAIGQTLRYMGWVRMNMARHQGSVRGAIIASAIDDALYFALQCVPTLEAFTYSISGGRIDLCRFDSTKRFMDGLSTEQIRELLEDPRIRGSQ